jgi:hypothetical protein
MPELQRRVPVRAIGPAEHCAAGHPDWPAGDSQPVSRSRAGAQARLGDALGGNGSHDDMDYATFMRSLHALRPYFPAIAACGGARPDFAPLQQFGIDAEAAMLHATGGVNTHRGGDFQSWPAQCGQPAGCSPRDVKRARRQAANWCATNGARKY